MKVDVKVTIDPSAMAKLEEAAKEALGAAMEALATEVLNAQVIPRDEGDLSSSQGVSFAISNQGATAFLSYNTPYARRLYFNPDYSFRVDKNINARGKWLDEWILGNKKDFLPTAFAKLLKEKSGGLIK